MEVVLLVISVLAVSGMALRVVAPHLADSHVVVCESDEISHHALLSPERFLICRTV
jgi:hypothetical protein